MFDEGAGDPGDGSGDWNEGPCSPQPSLQTQGNSAMPISEDSQVEVAPFFSPFFVLRLFFYYADSYTQECCY